MAVTKLRVKIFPAETDTINALYTERNLLRKQINDLDKKILAEVQRTPTFNFVKGLSRNSVPSGEVRDDAVHFELSSAYLDQRDIDMRESAATYEPSVREKIGDTALNSLLNGKTLNEDEKRKLISKILPPGIMDASPDTAA